MVLKAIRRIARRTASLEPGGGMLHRAVHPTGSLTLSLYFRYRMFVECDLSPLFYGTD